MRITRAYEVNADVGNGWEPDFILWAHSNLNV
jgi:hypothetical protein